MILYYVTLVWLPSEIRTASMLVLTWLH